MLVICFRPVGIDADLFDIVRCADAAGYEAAPREWKTLHSNMVLQLLGRARTDNRTAQRRAKMKEDKNIWTNRSTP